MIKRFFNRLARLLHAAAALCERAAAKCKESKCKDPLCKESKCDDPTPYRRGRLKFLIPAMMAAGGAAPAVITFT